MNYYNPLAKSCCKARADTEQRKASTTDGPKTPMRKRRTVKKDKAGADEGEKTDGGEEDDEAVKAEPEDD